MPISYRQWGTDLDANALQQMKNACQLPVSVAAALMPDAHVGYGLPIGGVLATHNAVIPYAVGVDIACRVKLTVLDLPLDYLRRNENWLTKAIAEGKTPAMIVVYVNGMIRSSYVDSADGKTPVETVTIKELIPHVDATYRTIATRDGRMIEGFSMGGSGAAKWGFKHTDLFGSISIIDGSLDTSEEISGRAAQQLKTLYGALPGEQSGEIGGEKRGEDERTHNDPHCHRHHRLERCQHEVPRTPLPPRAGT